MSNKSLEGRKAIVTGAASGIGAAIVNAFIEEGATVIGVDLPSAEWTDEHLGALSRLAVDLTGKDASEMIITAARERLGGLDILVNNAGIAPFGGIETTTDDVWDEVIAINVSAIFRLTRQAVPLLQESVAGRIINAGSIMSEVAGPETLAYITSKHAVLGMTKGMSVDLGKYGITVNCLQPGSVVTPLTAPHMQNQKFVDRWTEKTPLGRLGRPDDIAAVAVFLASDAARYVSGAGVRIDGGAALNAV